MRFATLGVLGLVVLVSVGGCPIASLDSRTSNQGGGSLISAVPKLINGEMTSLSPDELQLITDFLIQQNQDPNLILDPMTDDQAQALAWFIEDNQINSLTDVEYLINNPDEVVLSDRVLEYLESDEAAELLEQFFGADLSAITG